MARVRSARMAANGAGLSDVVGNLWEWTEDCYGDNCVVHGGSWSGIAENLRPGARLRIHACVRE